MSLKKSKILIRTPLNLHIKLGRFDISNYGDFQSMKESENVSLSVVSESLWLHGLWPTRLLCPWGSPGKDTGVGSHSLLQGILPIQGSNPSLLHCGRILYPLSHQGRSFLSVNMIYSSILLGFFHFFQQCFIFYIFQCRGLMHLLLYLFLGSFWFGCCYKCSFQKFIFYVFIDSI